MSSEFLSKFLVSEGNYLPNVSSEISGLISHSDSLKSDLKAVVEKNSIQFNPLLNENEKLKNKADELLKEMFLVTANIEKDLTEELFGCAEELQNLSTSLKEITLFLNLLRQLVDINTHLNKSKKKLAKKAYLESAETLTTVHNLIENSSESLKKVDIFKLLYEETVLTYEQLMYKITELWCECVKFSTEETKVEIFISRNSENDMSQILKASTLLKSNLIEKKFSNIFLNTLNKVILNESTINIEVRDKAVLTIELSKEKKPNYLKVFESISTIIKFLKTHLQVNVEKDKSFLSQVGNFIHGDFANALIKNCLSETIPSSSEDLDKYQIVMKNVEEFEISLQEAEFFPMESSSLLDYAKNINVLFANKVCQSYLEKARTIMKKDLYNVTNPKDVVSDTNVLPEMHKSILKDKMKIKDDVFSFPKCQISKQAEEIMNLVEAIMKEIPKSSDLCAVRLFYTVRNIFEMYSAIVPLHHKKFLETLPHQVALFHNNCMYFAHNAIHLVTEDFNKIPSILKDHYTILLEEAVVLRSLAAETLKVTVTNQKNQLIYILRDSGFATLNENPKLDPNSEKSIRQCIRQLQLLQNVWSEVLPLAVYNRAIGFFLDAVLDKLISLIISVEDISSQTASDLESCFNVIVEKAPSLFQEPREIHRHSKKFQKFKELILILKGTLRDIDDRWANGLGPLAIEFTPEQIKHLVRALFQNSDRRAALLAKIR